jgi:hypothetical protein
MTSTLIDKYIGINSWKLGCLFTSLLQLFAIHPIEYFADRERAHACS